MSAALDLLGGLVLDDGRRWGEAAESWQRADAEALLGDKGPRLHAWTRPRGGSKTTDGAGCAIASLVELWPPSGRAYAFAVDEQQAAQIVEHAAGLVHRSGLSGLLEVQSRRVVNRQTGAQLVVMSADSASAYGLLGEFFWCDELTWWPLSHRELWAAIVSALPKRAGSRLVAVGTAGDPASWTSKVLRDASESAAWRFSRVPGPLGWHSAEVLEEQRRLLTDSQYSRLILNVEAAAEDTAFDRDDVLAAASLEGPLEPRSGVSYVLSLDLGWRGDATAVCVAHRELGEHGRVVIDRLETYRGSRAREVDLGAVEARVLELARRYRARVFVDPAQAVLLAQRLRSVGLQVKEHVFSQASNTKLALRLLELVRARRLAMPANDELVDEFLAVRITERGPGIFKVDHSSSGHDDQVVAVGMACVHLEVPDYGPAYSAVGQQAEYRLPQVGGTHGASLYALEDRRAQLHRLATGREWPR